MEENTMNPNSFEGGEDGENRQSINTENTEQFVQGLIRDTCSMYGSCEPNIPVAETEPAREQKSDGQRQPADTSSADSHSRSNRPQITAADRLARKREADKAYRARVKEGKRQMKSTLDTLKTENGQLKTEMKSLKEENVFLNQQFQRKSGELEALGHKFDELQQNLSRQHERKRELKSDLKKLQAENGRLKNQISESQKEGNVLKNQTQSNELGQLRSKLENLEKDLASMKTCGNWQSIGGSSTNFIIDWLLKKNNLIGDFGQYWPNVETEGSMQSSPAIELPGFRFFPTEKELLDFYLKNMVGKKLPFDQIGFLNIYDHDPWELPGLSKIGEREWYFFVPGDRNNGNGGRPNRTTKNGFWEALNISSLCLSDSKRKIGLKETFVFYLGRAPNVTKTNWFMDEYSLLSGSPLPNGIVLCKIYRQSNGENSMENSMNTNFYGGGEDEENRRSHNGSCRNGGGIMEYLIAVDHMIDGYDKRSQHSASSWASKFLPSDGFPLLLVYGR